MAAIPFGAIGVVFGHMLFGYNLQFLSAIGFLALTGIVVNDSLILVSFAKRMRAEGMDRVEAMLEAGRVRVRPIMLTSITTSWYFAADIFCNRTDGIPFTDGSESGFRPVICHRRHSDCHPLHVPDRR